MSKPKTIKDQLAAGAEEIRKAKNAAKAPKPSKEPKPKKAPKAKKSKEPESPSVLVEAIIPSDKPLSKLEQQWLTFNDDKTSVTLNPKTPLEAFVPILKNGVDSVQRGGYLVGELIVQGRDLYGKDFDAIMAASGVPLSTLRIYEDTVRSVSAEHRTIGGLKLDFSAAREVARLKEPEQQQKLIREIEATVTQTGIMPNVKEIRAKSRAVKPARKKGPGKVAKAKAAKKEQEAAQKVAEPPYEPTEDEQAQVEAFEGMLSNFSTICENEGLRDILLKLSDKDKKGWSANFKPITWLAQLIEDKTGY